MSQTAHIVSLTEFLTRRAIMDMRARGTQRQFIWGVPGLGASVVLGFRPAKSELAGAKTAQGSR